MNVKDSVSNKNHFMLVKTSKDGKPVGIFVKRRGNRNKSRKPKEGSAQFSEEIPEIIGIRDEGDDRDEIAYRNAKIVNNKLLLSEKWFNIEMYLQLSIKMISHRVIMKMQIISFARATEFFILPKAMFYWFFA